MRAYSTDTRVWLCADCGAQEESFKLPVGWFAVIRRGAGSGTDTEIEWPATACSPRCLVSAAYRAIDAAHAQERP